MSAETITQLIDLMIVRDVKKYELFYLNVYQM